MTTFPQRFRDRFFFRGRFSAISPAVRRLVVCNRPIRVLSMRGWNNHQDEKDSEQQNSATEFFHN